MRRMIDKWESQNLDLEANKTAARKNQANKNDQDDEYPEIIPNE